mgnify:CR=1 FL=1
MKRRERAIMSKLSFKDRVRKILLQLLDDLEIQEKIRSIFGGEPHTSNIDTAELQHLQEELERAKKEISDLQQKVKAAETKQIASDEKISNLRETNTTLQNKCNEAQTNYNEAKTEIDRYRETYGALEDAFSQFHRLDSDIQTSFQSILNASSPIAFLLSGSDLENIRLYFEKVCMEWEKYSDDTLKILNNVFDYLFEQFRINHPEYHRIETFEGETFNLEKHDRTSSSPPVGKIKRIIISGYTNQTGSKKMKSYVEIG